MDMPFPIKRFTEDYIVVEFSTKNREEFKAQLKLVLKLWKYLNERNQ